MTTLTYTVKEYDKPVVKISLDGHAGYNPGNDIVCASISAITFQLLNTLDDLEVKNVIDRLNVDIADGHAVICFTVKNKDYWEIVWNVIKTGYENIAEQYPNNLFFK